MFCIKPTAINEHSTEDPPYDSSGSGTPVTGMMRMFIPMLIKTWLKMSVTTPTATSLPKRSRAEPAILNPVKRTTA